MVVRILRVSSPGERTNWTQVFVLFDFFFARNLIHQCKCVDSMIWSRCHVHSKLVEPTPQRSPSSRVAAHIESLPPPRFGESFVSLYPGSAVLFGGDDGSQFSSDMYEFTLEGAAALSSDVALQARSTAISHGRPIIADSLTLSSSENQQAPPCSSLVITRADHIVLDWGTPAYASGLRGSHTTHQVVYRGPRGPLTLLSPSKIDYHPSEVDAHSQQHVRARVPVTELGVSAVRLEMCADSGAHSKRIEALDDDDDACAPKWTYTPWVFVLRQ